MTGNKILAYQAYNLSQDNKGVKVLVGGCFDIFHIGHLRFLIAAKKKGDWLIIALESDDFIRVKKKRNPFHTQQERAEILSYLDCVDSVVMLPYFTDDNDYMKMVNKIKPEIIAVTENDKLLSKKISQAKQIGGRLEIVTSFINNKSSIDLLKAIKKLD
ncbi:hypothetical protein A3C23_00065 [Candidatus Roizmanbacteria bacterium RIFCSPHIGHO2_02_FULL_37_13b]|uniref:Cytidyltransferase-like domain-containing protein n=1 Tax=Candidatus Roizmanbacteria bacterium RIFCSPLOWO2_02_FULL_36_11 TaxID=1802071 RepID=A0A1F7JHK6_9BACT|nr:MAG: hypothetical protein A3C23_00065 [Candidatus Roizmanbacteria bacterium RIFCSPHIGHO2_02_FULL_37_13b]OGK55095.1 MAG: hypothetical protein A3H78_03880 [Candidatus Roizmanbacteria bacterium RIFCSPLOWO2_02_FULL_36_11]